MKLFRGEQRESRTVGPQIEPRLRAEDRQCAGAGAIGPRLTFLQNQPEKIVILPHGKTLLRTPSSPISFAGRNRLPSSGPAHGRTRSKQLSCLLVRRLDGLVPWRAFLIISFWLSGFRILFRAAAGEWSRACNARCRRPARSSLVPTAPSARSARSSAAVQP